MTSPDFHILLIEDDADARANLADILQLDAYTVESAGTLKEAFHRENWAQFGAIIIDRRLPDGSAEDALPKLRSLAPRAAVIIVTGYADLDGAIAAIRQGAADYLLKPINIDLLRNRLAGIVARQRAADEIASLHAHLQQRVNELQALFEVIPIGLAVTHEAACNSIRVNPPLARWLGIDSTQSATLAELAQIFPGFSIKQQGRELPPEEVPLYHTARTGVELRGVELEVCKPTEEPLHLLSYVLPLRDEQGQPRGAVGAFVDLSEQKRAQERLLQNERLAAIGQMMTGLAHESGNALARSQACLEMLACEVAGNTEALDLIQRIQLAQDHLKQLYDEVRNYAVPVKLEIEPCDVAQIWRQAWTNLSLRRQGRSAELVEELGAGERVCPVDRFRLEQVFRNLFENALAACTDPTRIRVRCLPDEGPAVPFLTIQVCDNGPGLNAEQRRRIFEPFYTTKTKGTGLGMPIAKRIVESHGGTLRVGSASPGGAELILQLPRERS